MSIVSKIVGKVIEDRLEDLSKVFEDLKNKATDVKSYILVDLSNRLDSIRTEEDDDRAADVANEIDAEITRVREAIEDMRTVAQKAISESETVNRMIDELEKYQDDLEDRLVKRMEERKQSRDRARRE